MRTMNVIRSYLHDVYTEEVNKVALSANDDKRVILEDGILTLTIDHYKTERRTELKCERWNSILK